MSSILEIIELTKRYRNASAHDRLRRQLPEPIADSCLALLEEAEALGLELDEVINAIRQQATQTNLSN